MGKPKMRWTDWAGEAFHTYLLPAILLVAAPDLWWFAALVACVTTMMWIGWHQDLPS